MPDQLPEPDLSGQTLDRYTLLRRIGVGGMGAVYEAEHISLRKRFAIKMLRYEFARDEIFRKRFLREARAASAVNHPHIVGISDFGESPEGHVFFVMELLEGRDLHDVLEAEGRLSWPRTREILLQTISALEAAHLQSIVHRDIKPSNVFLAEIPGQGDDDMVKVLDFGIAKLSSAQGEATAKLTSTDEIFGTVAYMAPEMAMGSNGDCRSDIYAVGVMMYRMLTGTLPFAEGNAFLILFQHINAPIPSLRFQEPSIPEAVEAIVLKAMAKRPDDRFGSMADLGRALRQCTPEGTELLMVASQVPLYPGPVSTNVNQTPWSSSQGSVPSASGSSTQGRSPSSGALSADAGIATQSGGLPPDIRGLAVAEQSVIPPRSEPKTSHRSPLKLVLSALVAAVSVGTIAVLGTIAVFMSDVPSNRESVTTEQAHAVSAPLLEDAKPTSKSVKASEPEPEVLVPEPEVLVPEPEVLVPEPSVDAIPEPVHTPKPKRSKPKPKTDQQVVAALRAKILNKCKAAGSMKVKIEGIISSTGKVDSLLVTPPVGLGQCTKIVKAARFDPKAGARAMPRFSVDL